MADPVSDAELERQITAGRKRADAALRIEPRARAARYDRRSKRVVVELTNGAMFAFPAEMGQGLRGASIEELSEVEVSPSGLGLHWRRLDADLLVPALLRGMFGTREWMKHLGQAGGASRSEAKGQAARTNGARGGRPRTKPAEAPEHAPSRR
jgi:hypothetical protein